MNDSVQPNDIYRPTSTLCTLTVIGLCCFALLDMAYIPGGLYGMIGVGVFDGGIRDQNMIDISRWIRGLSGLAQLCMSIFLTISFCMLMYRCAKNARALGFTGFSHTPGWVVGWYFVPFALLIMPYKAIAEIWKSSKAEVVPGTYPEWWDESTGVLIQAWWATWIVGTLFTNWGSMLSRSDSLSMIGMCIIPFAAITQVISAFLCIAFVCRLTSRQSAQAKTLGLHPNP